MLWKTLGSILAMRSRLTSTFQADGFINSCAYPGANLTGHSLGLFCLNNDGSNFGYNYTQYAHFAHVKWEISKLTTATE
jgi:hypothetical protein